MKFTQEMPSCERVSQDEYKAQSSRFTNNCVSMLLRSPAFKRFYEIRTYDGSMELCWIWAPIALVVVLYFDVILGAVYGKFQVGAAMAALDAPLVYLVAALVLAYPCGMSLMMGWTGREVRILRNVGASAAASALLALATRWPPQLHTTSLTAFVMAYIDVAKDIAVPFVSSVAAGACFYYYCGSSSSWRTRRTCVAPLLVIPPIIIAIFLLLLRYGEVSLRQSSFKGAMDLLLRTAKEDVECVVASQSMLWASKSAGAEVVRALVARVVTFSILLVVIQLTLPALVLVASLPVRLLVALLPRKPGSWVLSNFIILAGIYFCHSNGLLTPANGVVLGVPLVALWLNGYDA